MDGLPITDTLGSVLQGFAFVLVAGALAMIVHALARPRERWRVPFARYVWAVLGVAYIVIMAAALIFRTDLAATLFGIGVIAIYAVELTYLLRVVFAPRVTARERTAVEPAAPESAPATPGAALDTDDPEFDSLGGFRS